MNNPEAHFPTLPTLAALIVVLARAIREYEGSGPVDRLTYDIREHLGLEIESFCESEIPRNPRIQDGLKDIWRRIQEEADSPTM